MKLLYFSHKLLDFIKVNLILSIVAFVVVYKGEFSHTINSEVLRGCLRWKVNFFSKTRRFLPVSKRQVAPIPVGFCWLFRLKTILSKTLAVKNTLPIRDTSVQASIET